MARSEAVDTLEWLAAIRAEELEFVVLQLPPGGRILELGGGTGHQALALTSKGFDVTSLDIDTSVYREDRVFDVRHYDGSNIPEPNASFDVVFSSNVLEHVKQLGQIQQEIRRVLKPSGFALHLLPSPAWRISSYTVGFAELTRRLSRLAVDGAPGRETWLKRAPRTVWEMARLTSAYVRPWPHGEFRNAFVEMYEYSASAWTERFKNSGFDVDWVKPVGLFYTAHFFLGKRLPILPRKRFSQILGSACTAYRLRPRQ